jgi:predicted DNA-binding protein
MPRKNTNSVRWVRFPADILKALDDLSKKDTRTISAVIRIAVEQYLARRGAK